MITEKDLQEAIAECIGQRKPTANTCIKLAAFYIIKNELFGEAEQSKDEPLRIDNTDRILSLRSGQIGNDNISCTDIVIYNSGSDFSNAVNGKELDKIMPVLDELMETVSIINPRLYNSVLLKLSQLSD